MPSDLSKATAFAIVVHAALLCAGWSARPALVDVERGVARLEVEMMTSAELPAPEAPPQVVTPAPQEHVAPSAPTTDEVSWTQEPAAPPARPRLRLAPSAGHGAITEAHPQAIRNQPPTYPWVARLRGWEGVVMLAVRVGVDGRAAEVRVTTSSGYAILDQAAQQAVSTWAFLPATRGGQAVSSTVRVPVRFRLTEVDAHVSE